jgi:hypothetical protein
MNKIKKITQIKSSDKLPTYDLKETKWALKINTI